MREAAGEGRGTRGAGWAGGGGGGESQGQSICFSSPKQRQFPSANGLNLAVAQSPKDCWWAGVGWGRRLVRLLQEGEKEKKRRQGGG